MRKELCAIRDKVNVLIDAIDRVPQTSSSSTAPGRRGASESRNVTQQSQPAPQTTVKGEGKCVCVCVCVCVCTRMYVCKREKERECAYLMGDQIMWCRKFEVRQKIT